MGGESALRQRGCQVATWRQWAWAVQLPMRAGDRFGSLKRVGRRSPSTPRTVNVRQLVFAAGLLLTAGISTARAQAGDWQPLSGPTVAAARAAVSPDLHMDAQVPASLDLTQRLTRSESLMIIGGAIFLAGAIIGDDPGTIIMIGGAAVGIYGLYLYLQ